MNKISRAEFDTAKENALATGVFDGVLDKIAACAVVDMDGNILYASEGFCEISDRSISAIIGKDCGWSIGGRNFEQSALEINSALGSQGVWRAVCDNTKPNGDVYWVDCNIFCWKHENGEQRGYLMAQINITDSVQQYLKLQKNNNSIVSALEHFPGGLLIFDKNHKLIFCNKKHKQILELPDELFENGTPTLETITRSNAMRGEYGEGEIEELVQKRISRARLNEPHVYERTRPNGTVLEVRGAPLADGGFVSTHVDITEKKNVQNLIAHMAHHDPLTGLANRAKFESSLKSISSLTEHGKIVAIHYLDLDRFKAVNDTKGHSIGDQLLQAVAERLKKLIGTTDIVARLGGDEFSIIQTDVHGPACAGKLAKDIVSEISKPFHIDGHTVNIGTSVGIALAPLDGVDGSTLLYSADVALYRAKSERRGTFRFYEKDMDIEMRQRAELVLDLRRAIELDELHILYQPIMSLEEDRPTSFEALLRWDHSSKGPIETGVLIAAAEESGLITPIGEWTLRASCEEAMKWPENISISVNVSVIQFRTGNFAEIVLNILSDTGLDPSRLILEITESLLIKDNDSVEKTLNILKAAGVRFALDDFGTGYSSLSYLNSIEFDKLKIDRSFVCNVKDYNKSRSIFRAIAGLGSSLNITTVAEGVEGSSQLETSITEGVKEFQGYLFSRPVAPKDVPKTFGLTVSEFRKNAK
ncbi:MAG: sensor domain-containing protein [Hyphomicrobiaceae bacterium]